MKNALVLLILGTALVGCPNNKPDNWHLFGKNGINISPAWDISQGNSNTSIGIVDVGFITDNPAFTEGSCTAPMELKDLVFGERNTEGGTHGTTVSSFISDCEGNSSGLIGINRYSPILWLEVGKSFAPSYDLLKWAIGEPVCGTSPLLSCQHGDINQYPVDILNASFGRLDTTFSLGPRDKTTIATIEKINGRGSILVAAAGNESSNADLSFPASWPGVISAGATTIEGKTASFSNWGETVEIMAPGDLVPGASPTGWEYTSGTSFSAPITTGVVSLMRSVYPDLNWKTAIYLMQSTAVKMDCNTYCSDQYEAAPRAQCTRDCCNSAGEQTCTPGRLNAGAAVAAAQDAQNRGLGLAIPTSLIDSNKYLIKMNKIGNNQWRGEFTLTNAGGASGTYTISSDKKDTKFSGEINKQLTIAPQERVTVQVDKTDVYSVNPWHTKIRIATKDSGKVSAFSDELTIFAE